jgi:hypothetical protein
VGIHYSYPKKYISMRPNSRIFFVYRFVAAANLSAQHSVSIFVPAILFPVKRGLVSLNFFFGKATKISQSHRSIRHNRRKFIGLFCA